MTFKNLSLIWANLCKCSKFPKSRVITQDFEQKTLLLWKFAIERRKGFSMEISGGEQKKNIPKLKAYNFNKVSSNL